MTEKKIRLEQISKARKRCCEATGIICIAGMVGIFLSTTAPLTIGITAASAGLSYVGLRKIKKLDEEEQSI